MRPLWTPQCAACLSFSSCSRRAPCCATSVQRVGSVATVDLSSCLRSVARAALSARVTASRSSASTGVALARSRSARARLRADGRRGGPQRRRTRTAPTRAPPRVARPDGTSATRGGSGPSDRLQARTTGNVARVRAHLVWSPESLVPAPRPAARPGRPPIVSRRRGVRTRRSGAAPPTYATDVRFAIVHHTAGHERVLTRRGRSDRERDPALPRAGKRLERHRLQLSRRPLRHDLRGALRGVDRNVVGAHALGFNTGSVGIALLGTYGDAKPSAVPLRTAIAQALAWRLDLAHVDPSSVLTVSLRRQRAVRDRRPGVADGRVSGHRDTGLTECPGDRALRRARRRSRRPSRSLGGLKIFDPTADVDGGAGRGSLHGSHQAQSLGSRMVEATVASRWLAAPGRGTAVDWTWDVGGSVAGSYTWTISAGAARTASAPSAAGGGTPPLATRAVVARPEAISPNGDGQADERAHLRVVRGSQRDVDDHGCRSAGPRDAGRPGVDTRRAALARRSTAPAWPTAATTSSSRREPRQAVSVQQRGSADRQPNTRPRRAVTQRAFSPNADGRKDRRHAGFVLAAPADRTHSDRARRTVGRELRLPASISAGPQRFVWDGARAPACCATATYTAVVEATGDAGTIAFGVPFVSIRAPRESACFPGGVCASRSASRDALTFVVDGRHSSRRELGRA